VILARHPAGGLHRLAEVLHGSRKIVPQAANDAEVVEVPGDATVLRTEQRSIDPEGFKILALRLREPALEPERRREVAEAVGDGGVVVAEHPTVQRQGLPEQGLGLVQPTLTHQQQT
jgi:hypothetical protein